MDAWDLIWLWFVFWVALVCYESCRARSSGQEWAMVKVATSSALLMWFLFWLAGFHRK